jgi:CheY-like chemotaxis protein
VDYLKKLLPLMRLGGAGGTSIVSQAQILVVDDCKEWRRRLRSMLEAIPGYRIVAEAGDGLEAIEKAAHLRPDIVLLDIGHPEWNPSCPENPANVSQLKHCVCDSGKR